MTRLTEFYKTVYRRTLKSFREAGISAFSEETWSTLKSTAALIEQPAWKGTLQVHEQIVRLKKAWPYKTAILDVDLDDVGWFALIQPRYQTWQAQQMQFFNDPEWWYHCFSKIQQLPSEQRREANESLRRLQKAWALQSAYAHYSTLDVIHIYQTVIPVFSEWLNAAKTEFEKRKSHLTLDLKTICKDYLEWFERALQEEKQQLRCSMQERLVVGLKKGCGAWDKIIESLREELKHPGDLAPTSGLDRSLAQGHLTPEAFVTIRKIIETDGSEEEKATLRALAYYRPLFDDNLSVAQHKDYSLNYHQHQHLLSRNEAMSIKSIIYPYLPNFLQWVFWDETVNEQFFQHPDYQFLLAQEAAFLKTEIDASTIIVLSDLFIHPTWQESQMCLKLLQNERQRIEQWLEHPLAFLFPDTIRQLGDYRKTLEQSANSWIAKQLKLLQQSLEHKEGNSLSVDDKAVLTSILVEIQTIQKQWTFSEALLTEFAEIKQRYQILRELTQELDQDEIDLLSLESASQPLSVRDEFCEVIAEVVRVFELTHTESTSYLDPLKKQLEVDAVHYDSVVLRCWLTDYLDQEKTLPDQLKSALQGILEQPKFSEDALNRSENIVLSTLKSSSLSYNPAATDLDNAFPVVSENLWETGPEKFTQHCLALKNAVIPLLTDPASIMWNQKLCEYTLAFLKKIQALEKWEDFVLYRKLINELLQILIAVSLNQFPALHQSLAHLAAAEKEVLDQDGWDLFIEFSLAIPMKTIGRFLHIENSDEGVTQNDAASFESQRTFSFLRPQTSNPPISCIFTDSPINRL